MFWRDGRGGRAPRPSLCAPSASRFRPPWRGRGARKCAGSRAQSAAGAERGCPTSCAERAPHPAPPHKRIPILPRWTFASAERQNPAPRILTPERWLRLLRSANARRRKPPRRSPPKSGRSPLGRRRRRPLRSSLRPRRRPRASRGKGAAPARRRRPVELGGGRSAPLVAPAAARRRLSRRRGAR
jgi:hypothetical protein